MCRILPTAWINLPRKESSHWCFSRSGNQNATYCLWMPRRSKYADLWDYWCYLLRRMTWLASTPYTKWHNKRAWKHFNPTDGELEDLQRKEEKPQCWDHLSLPCRISQISTPFLLSAKGSKGVIFQIFALAPPSSRKVAYWCIAPAPYCREKL